MENQDLPLIKQYASWLRGGPGLDADKRARFFSEGLVVLDTSVLLSLYEYRPAVRDEVMSALELVRERLWLPHQVGVELVRGRHRVVDRRADTLRAAIRALEQKRAAARTVIREAASDVADLIQRYAGDQSAVEAIEERTSHEALDEALSDIWSDLKSQVQGLQKDPALELGPGLEGDSILPRLARLYGDRIGPPPSGSVLKDRVGVAESFRFPNKIPPGFEDADKSSPLESAGDFLLWEEVLEYVGGRVDIRHVLFVTADLKQDWQEVLERGRGARPHPRLVDELWNRSGAELQIEPPEQFLRGVREYLGGAFTAETYQQLDEAGAESEDPARRRMSDAVNALSDALREGRPPEEVVDLYTNLRPSLEDTAQTLAVSDLEDFTGAFVQFRRTLSDVVRGRYGDRIPEWLLRIPYGSRTHELLFAALFRNLGSPVSAQMLRVLTKGAVHTERRARELREMGLDIRWEKIDGEEAYVLQSMDLQDDVIPSIILNNVKRALRAGRITPAEHDELIGELE